MTETLKIQERLKEIAAELAALNEGDETLTDEQEAKCEALEAEADGLTADLDTLRADESKAERRRKAEEIRNYAKSSSRQTAANPTTRIGRIKNNIEDDPKRGFKSLAHFAARVYDAGQNVRGDEMLMQVAAGTGMTQSVNSEGGVLVPPSFSKAIWDKVGMQPNSLLQYCDQIPIDSGVESVTIPAVNETSRADGSRMGGIRGYWKSELTGMTESRPQFREVKLTPHELFVFAYVSDKLLRNSPSTASSILETGAANEIAFKVGDALINGDGAGKPRGIITHAATVSVAKETNQAAGTILYENISKMWARCHMNWRPGAVWFCNQDIETALRAMVLPVGVGGVPVYLPPGGASDSPFSMLFGRPLIPIEYCPTLGTVGDIILGNFMAYAVGLKGMVDSAYSMHLKFDYAQTAYRVIFEVDGQPWLNSAITPFKGSNSLSPFVTLATRA